MPSLATAPKMLADAYQRHHWRSVMASADVNGVAGITWATNESASARSTAIAFYLRVTRGVIYISAGNTAVCRILLSLEEPLWTNVNDRTGG